MADQDNHRSVDTPHESVCDVFSSSDARVPSTSVFNDAVADEADAAVNDSAATKPSATNTDGENQSIEPPLPGTAIPVVEVPFKLNSDPDLSLAIPGPLYAKVGEPLFPPVVVQFVKHNRMERFRLCPPSSLVTQPPYDSETFSEPLSPGHKEYGMLFNTMHRCSGVQLQLLPIGRDGKLFPSEGIIVKDLMGTLSKDQRLFMKDRWGIPGRNPFRFEGSLSTHTTEGAARGIKMKECKDQPKPEGTRYHRKGGHHGGAKKGPTVLYATFPNIRIPCEGQYKLYVVAMDWMGNATSHLLSDRIITAKETRIEAYEKSMNEPTPEELELLEKLRKNGTFGIVDAV